MVRMLLAAVVLWWRFRKLLREIDQIETVDRYDQRVR